MTYIVSGGALNSLNSIARGRIPELQTRGLWYVGDGSPLMGSRDIVQTKQFWNRFYFGQNKTLQPWNSSCYSQSMSVWYPLSARQIQARGGVMCAWRRRSQCCAAARYCNQRWAKYSRL